MAQRHSDEIKTKPCHRCGVATDVAYRVRYDESRAWVFVCGKCVTPLKRDNPFYTYGGTWKGSRH